MGILSRGIYHIVLISFCHSMCLNPCGNFIQHLYVELKLVCGSFLFSMVFCLLSEQVAIMQYRNMHFPGSAMFYWSVSTVIFLWSLLDRFICLSPLDPSYVQTGWGDFVRIRRLKWKSYSPLQARFTIWNQKMLLEFTQVSLCGNHFMHSGYRQYEHQIMDSLHINLLIWRVSLLKIWHCLLSSLLSLDVLHSKMWL